MLNKETSPKNSTLTFFWKKESKTKKTDIIQHSSISIFGLSA